MNNTTYSAKKGEVESKWYIIDAANKPLGRVATEAAKLLRGKHKPTYTPNIDTGDHVIILNCKDVILISSCKALKPFFVPATLKSISPRWSSSPRISERMAYFSYLSPSVISPMAIPATGFFIGTPAASIQSVPPHTEAIEEEPLDSIISETTLIVYGNSSLEGTIGSSERRARFP